MKILQKICFVLLLGIFSSVYGGDCFKDADVDHCLMKSQLGDSDAQFKLGNMYYDGQGVVQDYKESVKWFTKAAEQGESAAQYNLGLMYTNGEGVVQDYKESVKWYRLAAEQGDSLAQYNLGERFYNGKGVIQDYKEAVKWFRLAAERGDSLAQYNLGSMYTNGEGVVQDYKESVKWYRLAAEQGDSESQKLIQLYTKDAGQGNSYALEWMREYEKQEKQENEREGDRTHLTFILLIVTLGCLYFLPSIISFRREHRNRWLIFLVNLVFGVTVLGWIGSLIWSLNKVDDPTKGGYKTDGQDGDHHF